MWILLSLNGMLLWNGSDGGVLTSFFFGTDSDMCAGGGFYFDHCPREIAWSMEALRWGPG